MKDARLTATTDLTKRTIQLTFGEKRTAKLFITIRDLYGQIIKNSLMQIPTDVDISDLHPGSYFVETIECREVIRASFEVE